jgi:ribokinase
MHITTLGDVMLDVIVDAPGGLRPDDDTEASITLRAGGQAANVAVWCAALGAAATLIGPRAHVASHPSDGGAGSRDGGVDSIISARLADAGVTFVGKDAGAVGTVVSLLEAGTRTMASDPGDQTWLSQVEPADLPARVDWLHVSAYPLLRADDPGSVVDLAAEARRRGGQVCVDLASAALLAAFGAARFARLIDDLQVSLVFANLLEWEVIGAHWTYPGFDVLVKEGPRGATLMSGASTTSRPSRAGQVVDATGAGDALAAGYLVGGIDLGLETAARCVTIRGAQPNGR